MSIYRFENKIPKIAKSSYIHPRAAIIGDVEIGGNCFIGAGAVLRGDFGEISIGRGTSIQENCVIHVGGEMVFIDSNVIIAHGAILHDVTIKLYVLNTGEAGIVTRLNPRYPLRPVVSINQGANGPGKAKSVDLSATTLVHIVEVIGTDAGGQASQR